jgi:hypothetical protein
MMKFYGNRKIWRVLNFLHELYLIKSGRKWGTSVLLRIQAEAREEKLLLPMAVKSKNATRLRPEAECDVRTAFQRDRDRIIHSKAFRRLKHKTQVFIAPEGDHYRTRLTHTLEGQHYLTSNPELLPDDSRARISESGLERTVSIMLPV